MLNTQTLSESAGHQVSWTYTWNSAGVTNVAADNLTVRFRAYDFASSQRAWTPRPVDVVPYITDITRTLSTNRSKYGRFVVQEGETGVVLSGYNLAQTGHQLGAGVQHGGRGSTTRWRSPRPVRPTRA